MTIAALVLHNSPVKLWGLSSTERLHRQLREIGGVNWCESFDSLPKQGLVLLLNGHFLFELRTLKGLIDRPGSVLFAGDEINGGTEEEGALIAAALVDVSQLDAVPSLKEQKSAAAVHLPVHLQRLIPADLEAFDETLRRASAPLLERISEQRKEVLENQLYGNAYRGITDLVTKFVWPKPARKMVHFCARIGASPNAVTSFGLVLVLAACWLFLNGHYFTGLAAGWLMTFLDTVDGKLARTTIQSSPFGHLYDHAIDLIHPPFWYIFWGMSMAQLPVVFGLDLEALGWLLIAAYVGGRIAEGIFPLLGNCSIFTWRPFDAWFRLVTARRNPCLIILTVSALVGRPGWGFIAVVAWSALTTVVLFVRLLQGLVRRSG